MSAMTAQSASSSQRISVVQGMTYVSVEPVVLTTVLGSCVACCLFDPQTRIGGMNHFLLAAPLAGASVNGSEAERYGLFAMELLVNEMLKAGASRSGLRAHLYGGANLHAGMKRIGSTNADFARRFLANDGIPLVYANLGGEHARRVDFKTSAGQARCRLVDDHVPTVPRVVIPSGQHGDVELF